jgi:hypothetical protein
VKLHRPFHAALLAALVACSTGKPQPEVCVDGAPCRPTSACASSGVTTCDAAGQPTCQVTSTAVDGAPCGGVNACLAGSCEPPIRTLQISHSWTWWLADGSRQTYGLPGFAAYGAYVERAGGYDGYPADPLLGPVLTIPGVPRQRWFLVEGSGSPLYMFQQATSTLDLRGNMVGRRDAVAPTMPTPVSVELTGLDPWSQATSLLELGSASVALSTYAWGASVGAPDLPAGATTASGILDWHALFPGLPQPLLDASKGDVAWLHQVSPRAVVGGPFDGTVYQAASRALRLSGVTLASGAPGTLTGALAPTPAQGALHVTVDPSAWAAHRAEMGPGVDTRPHALQIQVQAQPFGAGPAAPLPMYRADLLGYTGPDDTAGPLELTFGRFLDAPWTERLTVTWHAVVPYPVPGSSTPGAAQVSAGATLPMPVDGVLRAGLTLSPVTAPTIDGADLLVAQGAVGTTPLLAWSPPTLGVATSYTVLIYQLGGGGGTSPLAPALVAVTYETHLRVPPYVLTAGQSYLVVLKASAGPWDRIDRTDGAESFPQAWSYMGSAPFTVAGP